MAMKLIGDSVLKLFTKPVEAIKAAVDSQNLAYSIILVSSLSLFSAVSNAVVYGRSSASFFFKWFFVYLFLEAAKYFGLTFGLFFIAKAMSKSVSTNIKGMMAGTACATILYQMVLLLTMLFSLIHGGFAANFLFGIYILTFILSYIALKHVLGIGDEAAALPTIIVIGAFALVFGMLEAVFTSNVLTYSYVYNWTYPWY